MASTKKPQKNSGSTFSFENNIIGTSAFGDNSVVNNYSFDSENLEQFSLKLKELQNEVTRLSSSLPQKDISKVQNEINVVESQLKKPEKNTPQVILNSLKEIGGILSKASAAGIVLNQLFDIAKALFIR